ncbi:hypothetical protein PVAND_017323 [Polypedilum vanderplanki]|uniref:Leucine rich repeat protein n=1 Tax=Polypedilum vanderplanki TaxID=319348 RepID=A0A9J6BHX7_POLVA|nr:hypothetical protein PVAND_017323 [Polypedilum vanderplanki]
MQLIFSLCSAGWLTQPQWNIYQQQPNLNQPNGYQPVLQHLNDYQPNQYQLNQHQSQSYDLQNTQQQVQLQQLQPVNNFQKTLMLKNNKKEEDYLVTKQSTLGEVKNNVLKCHVTRKTFENPFDLSKVNEPLICTFNNGLTEPIDFQKPITNITGYHSDLYQINSTIKFQITNKYLGNNFPINLGHFFINLEYIFINNCNLTKFGKDNLKQFPKLKYINFNNNNVTSIESEAFKFNSALKFIDLKNNRIKEINLDNFEFFSKNKPFINLTNNTCVSQDCIDKAHFSYCIRAVMFQCINGLFFAQDQKIDLIESLDTLKENLNEDQNDKLIDLIKKKFNTQ